MRPPVPFVEGRWYAAGSIPAAAPPAPSPRQAAQNKEEEHQEHEGKDREKPEPPRSWPDVHGLGSCRRRPNGSPGFGHSLSHTCIVGGDADRASGGDDQRCNRKRPKQRSI